MLKMKLSVRVFLCLLFGSTAAQDFTWNPDGDQKPEQTAVQGPAELLQQKQSFHEPLSWRFPDPPPEDQPRYPPDFELKVPSAASSVSAVCGDSSVRVEAKKDLLGIGKPVQTEDLTLGGCPATGEDPEAQVLVFESELHGCGSELLLTEESLVYTFTLVYSPTPLGDAQILRAQGVSVTIQCHYQRKHDVSSEELKPTWSPFKDSKTSEENLHFSLRLMTDDWQFARPSSQFVLGDMMKFEVSVQQFHHVPLRVSVNSCVATVAPNIDTVPRYAFLGNGGCLFDSQLTGSTSRFLPRSQDDRLQFELEAFRFKQEDSGMIYVTCSVKATPASAAIDESNKACSFSNRWREAGGHHDVCSCCDSDCPTGSDIIGRGVQWEQEAAVGPIKVEERALR